ncbi:helix-turn-helix domain-containing protein [Aquimarina hainanensis]|uniref:Helix-turn-helix domain-containing protein n=4 Tax=Aquimarina hainanensis TaxID=1578017 RepID=A0ABW5N993_9FLAO|nr:AraC family transcriptional regulator [Aquimarina sp. TRL1]QKX05637.1 helix-turn-helix transcriptional regulator [Aquimarina sp. TRL1]
MYKYTFDFSDIDRLRDYFHSELDPKGTTDRIFFPPEIGDGYLQYYKISPEVFLLINNYTANADIEYIRKPAEERDLILHFRKYALDHEVTSDEIISRYSNGYTPGNMRCIDARTGERVFIAKGGVVKSTMIVLKKSFTKSYLMKGNEALVDKVDHYIKQSHKHINKFYLSYRQSKLFDQIVEPFEDKVESYLFYLARAVLLLETFWKDVLKWTTEENPFSINSSQIGGIYKVTDYLENNLNEPFIGVDQLATMAYMSRTSFFNTFKEIHNQTPLEFFNNKKLERSYNMIFTKQLSVKEVMSNLNYSNSSKFRKAFFDRFNIYPD